MRLLVSAIASTLLPGELLQLRYLAVEAIYVLLDNIGQFLNFCLPVVEQRLLLAH